MLLLCGKSHNGNYVDQFYEVKCILPGVVNRDPPILP